MPKLRQAGALPKAPKDEWLGTIVADKTISEPVRQRALQFAREWK